MNVGLQQADGRRRADREHEIGAGEWGADGRRSRGDMEI